GRRFVSCFVSPAETGGRVRAVRSGRMVAQDRPVCQDPFSVGYTYQPLRQGTVSRGDSANQRRKAVKRWFSAGLAVMALCYPLSATADEVTLIGPGGIRSAIQRLIPDFEKKTGHKVKATFGSGGGTKAQVVKGEPFDVPIVQPPLTELLASGHVVASTQTPLTSAVIGVAVRKGAPKPDISTPEAVKRMLRAAKSIERPNPAGGAAAGVALTEMFKQLGILEQITPKVRSAAQGVNQMVAVANGDVEIGMTFISEMSEPGIDLVGPLPKEICP